LLALPFVNARAQSAKSPEEAILTYRSIVLQDSTQLGLYEELFDKCVADIQSQLDCVCLFNSIYLGFEMRGQDWKRLLDQSRREYPGITFIDEIRMEMIAAIISLNRLNSLQLEKIVEPGSPYSPLRNSATDQLIKIMDLQPNSQVGVIQKNVSIIGELIAAARLDQEVVIYSGNSLVTESLFKSSPVSSAPSWKAPRYVYREDLKINSTYDHDKILLNEVLLHNDNMKPMLRRIISTLQFNDEVIVFEHVDDCCYHGSNCKEGRSAESVVQLFTKRSFRLIEKTEVGHYLMVRFKYTPF
jgi:hypothetical protein